MRPPQSPPPSVRLARRLRPLVLLLCAGLTLTSAATLVDAAPPSAAPAGPPGDPTTYLVGFHGKPPVGPGDA